MYEDKAVPAVVQTHCLLPSSWKSSVGSALEPVHSSSDLHSLFLYEGM